MTLPARPTALEDRQRIPAAYRPGAPLVVLLHGRGAAPDDLVSLADWMPEDAAVVFPQAPYPAAPWGYGPGYAWYRFLGGARPEPESFSAALNALSGYLAELPGRLPAKPGPLLLGGFSQGGTVSLAWALAHPGQVKGVLMLSGFLAEHPEVRVTAESAKDLDVFWGHGTEDPTIPFAMGAVGREALGKAGARVEAGDYPMGHAIAGEEMEDVRRYVGRSVSR